ncbi:MAG TPA: TatD family hydrolase [Nitrososphaerales archaeon]|nr:TatD family hydrolase [Nitrososphaerales archaeon]
MVLGELGPIWDAHVHLPAYPDPLVVVAAARRRGVRLVSVGVSPAEALPNLKLRSGDPSTVRCFIGIHPSEATSAAGGLEELSPLWDAADGVGEVGLDPKYSEVSAGSLQMELFKAQVEVAGRTKKPIQVHSRGAEGACLDVLERYSLGALLMHWFEGEELLGRVLSRQKTFVSFGPAILYSKKLMRMARRCPPETVLVESDGPVAFGALGGAEGPGLVPSVAFKLAELWGSSFDEAVLQLTLNAESYLG